ncbi:MAG: succinate dehydrogenase, hydrophobic membrane anchor protein [Alphaproteobacteria bacterium]
MSMINPLARVRGLGSAKDGSHHWIAQRMTAVALVPLTLWFVISLIGLIGGNLADIKAWLSSPFNAVLMILTLIAGFHHAQLGLQVVIEDYIHSHGCKIAAIWFVKGAAFFFGAAAVFSVVKLAIGA